MPDGDVFDRGVRRGWQTAARRMIGGGEGEEALPAVHRALRKEIKANGCPGLVQIIDILTNAIRSPQKKAVRRSAFAQLETLRVQHGNRATQIAIASGRRLLVALEPESAALQALGDGELRVHLSVRILAYLADASMCPAALLPALVEKEQLSFQEVRFRRQRAKELVAAASETRTLAIQLLADPSGVSVKALQIRRSRLSQSDLLATPLTA